MRLAFLRREYLSSNSPQLIGIVSQGLQNHFSECRISHLLNFSTAKFLTRPIYSKIGELLSKPGIYAGLQRLTDSPQNLFTRKEIPENKSGTNLSAN